MSDVFAADRRSIENRLDEICDSCLTGIPTGVADAIRYGLKSPGKRIRPLLLLFAYRAAGGSGDATLLACAPEVIHECQTGLGWIARRRVVRAMLTELRIKNFAIIEQVALPLAPGFNVLSGETGAGKSIIVGALGLLLGERASSDLIRSGADKATVEGVFDIRDLKAVGNLADERGIEIDDDILVLKREIAQNGRGRAWINGTTVTAGVLAEIGRELVNLHGQHDAQTLLDNDSQRVILDAFGGADDQAERVRDIYRELSDVRREIATLTTRRADAEKRADYLRHVAKEIEEAKLSPGEDTKLEDEARVLENADELRTLASALNELLSGDEGSVMTGSGTYSPGLWDSVW